MSKHKPYLQVVAYLTLMFALFLMFISVIRGIMIRGKVVSSENVGSSLLLIMLLLTIVLDSYLVDRTVQSMQKKGVEE